jgi:signal transduction histidine kinase
VSLPRQGSSPLDAVRICSCLRSPSRLGSTTLLNAVRLAIWGTLLVGTSLHAQQERALQEFDLQFTIDGKTVSPLQEVLRIPANAKEIGLAIKARSNAAPRSNSFRHKLEGVDFEWKSVNADLGFVARFLGPTGDAVRHENFFVNGDSPGWRGRLNDSKPVRRRENVKVPKDAARLTLLLTSAGGPAAVGTYAAENVSVSRHWPDGSQTQLFPKPGLSPVTLSSDGLSPADWMRDGVHASMARVARLDSPDHYAVALCIVDDDRMGHAEWRLKPEAEIPVNPEETLILQWDEAYCLGSVGDIVTSYHCPPPGSYRLVARSISPIGAIDVEKALNITVYRPYWMQAWFWTLVSLFTLAAILLGVRAVVRRRLRAYLRRMDQEHAVERERLRIARDLHDDLGARLTHISFFSQRAAGNGVSLEESQEKLKSIAAMTKNLVSSLYEAVWSVDPENDNLDALVNYLTQTVDHLCAPVDIQYRIKAPDAIPDCPVPSDVRHNISLAVKEAINNAIKHSGASMLTIAFDILRTTFVIVISDNGRGFDPSLDGKGNGLRNLKQRMTNGNGTAAIETAPGRGTTIRLEMPLRQTTLTNPRNAKE